MNNLQILLVDDSRVVRLVFTKQLQAFGFKVDCAEDGDQAVEAVQEKIYDLIFMDVNMPRLDGLQATSKIREFEKESGRRTAPIIGCTDYGNRSDCLDAGMNDYLFKPVTNEQLKGIIKAWYPQVELPESATISDLLSVSDSAPLIEPAKLNATLLANLQKRLDKRAAS